MTTKKVIFLDPFPNQKISGNIKKSKKNKEIFQDSETAQRGEEECKIGGYFSGGHQLSGNFLEFFFRVCVGLLVIFFAKLGSVHILRQPLERGGGSPKC